MRKLFVLFALLGCLMVAQSTLAAQAAYGDCCLGGCEGMSQCIGLSCPVCTVPAAAMAPSAPACVRPAAEQVAARDEPAPPASFAEVWTPPD